MVDNTTASPAINNTPSPMTVALRTKGTPVCTSGMGASLALGSFDTRFLTMTEPISTLHEITANDLNDGERLDKFLHLSIPETSRSRLKDLIKQGAVTLGKRTITEPNHRVKPGDVVTVNIPPAMPAIPEGENIPLDVVYEDDELIVINKPAGLVVHPAPGNWTGTLVNALIAHCGDSLSGIGGVKRPGIVHRLDKDTSGLMVVAKTDSAHNALAEQFAAHGRDGKLERTYLALVWGKPALRKGTIETQIARKLTDRKKMAVVKSRGKQAITHYNVISSHPMKGKPVFTLIKCRLETGRTHQIRVHMTHLGHPVLNDETYGAGFKTSARNLPEGAQKSLAKIGRQALHAAILGFEHPKTGEIMHFETPLPQGFADLIEALKHQ